MENETRSVVFPNMDWCFDIEIYYANSYAAVAAPLIKSFSDYRSFSFKYNGILTSVLVALGLIGSTLLLFQIHTSRHFSKRLSVHLGMICIWDSLYLLSCLATYGIPSLMYGMPPSYGLLSYILFVLQPFASFCVSCTIWQAVAITIERYYAVTKPLEQRTRKAKFGVYWICLAIAFGAFVVNLLPVPFERQLVDCFEISGDTFKFYTLLKPYNDTSTRLYRFIVHFFPDLLFRAPCPIVIIGYLTVKTIQQVCNQRTVGHLQINANTRRNIPLRLSLLNFKFVICNTLYMFNTILLELLGYGDSVEGGEAAEIDRYMNSYYLTDASNLLLVVHSATNWLIFYQLPMSKKGKNGFSTLSLNNSFKGHTVKPEVAEFVHRRVAANTRLVGETVLNTLFEEYPELRLAVSGEKTDGDKVGLFLEQVLKWFASSSRGEKLRELGRRLGEENFNRSLHFTPEQWKDIRTRVVDIVVKYSLSIQPAPYTKLEIHDNLTRAFNLVLSEMRSGSLCAAVEAHRKSVRSPSTTSWTGNRISCRTRTASSQSRVMVTEFNNKDDPLLLEKL